MYKIPAFGDIPSEFHVSLLRDCPNSKAIYSSKVNISLGNKFLHLSINIYATQSTLLMSSVFQIFHNNWQHGTLLCLLQSVTKIQSSILQVMNITGLILCCIEEYLSFSLSFYDSLLFFYSFFLSTHHSKTVQYLQDRPMLGQNLLAGAPEHNDFHTITLRNVNIIC